MTNSFARLGTNQIVREQIKSAKQSGATVDFNSQQGTVVITFNGTIIMKGLRKGASGQPWIVIYNADFYQR